MNSDDRIIEQSPLFQGKDEKIAYRLNTLPWGGSPSSVSVTLTLIKDGSDVISTNMESGAPDVSGDFITTKRIISLVPHVGYRLEFKWTYLGNEVETSVEIYGQK